MMSMIVIMRLTSHSYGHTVFTLIPSRCFTSCSICLFFTVAVLPSEQHPGSSNLSVSLMSRPCKCWGNMILFSVVSAFCLATTLPVIHRPDKFPLIPYNQNKNEVKFTAVNMYH